MSNAAPAGGVACAAGFGTLIVPGTLRCFLRDFNTTSAGADGPQEDWPEDDDFDAALVQWEEAARARNDVAARDVGLVDGVLHWVRLAYLAPVSESAVLESPGLLLEYNNEVRRLIDPLVANFSTPALRSAALHMDGFGQLGALAGGNLPLYTPGAVEWFHTKRTLTLAVAQAGCWSAVAICPKSSPWHAQPSAASGQS